MNNQCLFCDNQTIRACCDQCQLNCRSELFLHLLSLLKKIAIASDYYNQIKILCDKIRTIKWLLTPIQFDPLEYFDSSIHTIDRQAKTYLLKADSDVRNMVPIKTLSDGNCLYHSIVCLASNKTITASELRIRILLELIQNEQRYRERLEHIVGPFHEAVRRISINCTFSELYEIGALSNVLKCKIRSIYPRIQYRAELDFINNTFNFNPDCSSSNTIHIFWTHTQNEIKARQNNGGSWSPNHFVPLLLPSDSTQTCTDSSSRYVDFLESTESILTSFDLNKNHTAHLHLDDKQEHASAIYHRPNVLTENEVEWQLNSLNEDQAINCANSIPQHIEKQRAAARDRRASKRSAATPEQIERQRAANRERMALKRAASVSEEVEKQRSTDRERMASKRSAAAQEQIERQQATDRERMVLKRSAATPEQIERQRAANRERMALKRTASVSEEVERQRATDRERMASKRSAAAQEQIERQQATDRERMVLKRSAATPEQIERQRAANRERMALKRAASVSEEVERQRATDRERMASKRYAAAPEQIERQQATDRERMVLKRSVATPEQIKRQRAANRARMALKRTASVSEEVERQRATNRERMALKRRSIIVAEPVRNSPLNDDHTVSAIAMTTLKTLPSNCLDKEQPSSEISHQECDNHISVDVARRPVISKQKKKEDLEREWPKPASSDLKIKCLKSFIKHMSMNFLAEEICGICNIRCYKRDLHCVPLPKIPFVHVLKVHDDLNDILLKIQQAHNCVTQSSSKPSFKYENKIVFYERGLQHGLNNDRRQNTRCNICKECWTCLTKEKYRSIRQLIKYG